MREQLDRVAVAHGLRHHVANGALPSVAWIDPAFTNFNPLGFPVNDDHPPADIRDGQDLVLAVYDALAGGPQWERSLLLVVYDEHGGFYDHVPPPPAPDADPEMYGSYGVRVRRSSSRRGSSPRPCRARCSTTHRSSRRACCASAPRA